MQKFIPLLKVVFLMVSFQLLAIVSKAQKIHQWEVCSFSLKSSKVYADPYESIPVFGGGKDVLKVTFRGVSGEALNKEITVVGFWNGESEWRVNFAPPYTGFWTYVSSSADKSLDNKKGSLEVLTWTEDEKKANPTRHGFLQVRNSGQHAGHYFEYADGHPFMWIGDTWWGWRKKNIKLETFIQLIDNRSEKGFNIGQLFVSRDEGSPLDIEHLNKIEQMIRYANSKGIIVWINGWWTLDDMKNRIGEEKLQRWCRYLVHRFGAYNVIWVPAGEYNMFNNGGFSFDFWRNLGKQIKQEDPFKHLVSMHNTPPYWSAGNAAPQWATGSVLHDEPWLDYNQSQVGHGKFRNEMIPQVVVEEYNRQPAKPIVVTEAWYEFAEGSAPAMDIRFGAWSAILSGAAGHTYGGGHVWLAHVPESPHPADIWPLEKEFDRTTFDYPGAVSMKHLADFFKAIKWWNLSPHPELVKEYPQPFCLAKPGEEYILYLRYGGGVKIQMDANAAARSYKYHWYNPATGQLYDAVAVQGARLLELECPELYPTVVTHKDWVLYLRRE